MKRSRLSILAGCVGLAIALMAFVDAAHAQQQWTNWQYINDGNQNLLKYRTCVVPDTTAETGNIAQFEIESEYNHPVRFTAEIELLLGVYNGDPVTWTQPETWHLTEGTKGTGTYDTLEILSVNVDPATFQETPD